jgi:hypothetical protein
VLRHRGWLLPSLALSMALYGAGYLAVSVTPWFPLVLVLVFVAHFAGGTNWTLSNYALQGEVPDQLRGRVFATDLMLATLAITVSQLIATAFVDHVDPRVILAGCGLVTLTYAIGWRIATRKLALTSETARRDGTGPGREGQQGGHQQPDAGCGEQRQQQADQRAGEGPRVQHSAVHVELGDQPGYEDRPDQRGEALGEQQDQPEPGQQPAAGRHPVARAGEQDQAHDQHHEDRQLRHGHPEERTDRDHEPDRTGRVRPVGE